MLETWNKVITRSNPTHPINPWTRFDYLWHSSKPEQHAIAYIPNLIALGKNHTFSKYYVYVQKSSITWKIKQNKNSLSTFRLNILYTTEINNCTQVRSDFLEYCMEYRNRLIIVHEFTNGWVLIPMKNLTNSNKIADHNFQDKGAFFKLYDMRSAWFYSNVWPFCTFDLL